MKKKQDVVYVATREQLSNTHYLSRLWIATRNMPHSRREWLDQITFVIYDYRGTILCQDRVLWPIPDDIDAVFGGSDGRWISYWLEGDGHLPRRKPRLSSFERLRLFDLYFKIKHPDIARHFGR